MPHPCGAAAWTWPNSRSELALGCTRRSLMPLTSIHIPAAIDVQRLAGDVAVARQHEGGIGHFVAGAETADGDAVGRRLHIGRDHFGFDQRRRNRIRSEEHTSELQ